jgi:hypothetical protein
LTGRKEMLKSALVTSELTVCVPGPITREYTVTDQALPRKLFANKTHGMEDLDKVSCALARIEFFHDVRAREQLLAETYSRLKVLDPGLKTWPLYGNISDTNPQIDIDHFMATHCHGPFWVKDYATKANTGTTRGGQLWVFCRQHNEYEPVKK